MVEVYGRVGSEFLVNVETYQTQYNGQLTRLVDGKFLVTWLSTATNDNNIKGRIFTADGAPAGTEFLVNTAIAGEQYGHQTTALANGGFVVTWFDESFGVGGATGDSSGIAVKAQVFSADGSPVGSELLVNVATQGDQQFPYVTGLSDGGFVVTWNDGSLGVGGAPGDTSETSIKARVFTAAGAPATSEIPVNSATESFQGAQKITPLANGGFVITWMDRSGGIGGAGGDSDGIAVKGQVFAAGGVPVGGEFLVNSAVAGDQQNHLITTLANGNFVVTWQDLSLGVGGTVGDSSGMAVKAQLFSASGAKLGLEILVNSATAGAQEARCLIALSGGGFVVVWKDLSLGVGGAGGDTSGYAIKAQIFGADGMRVGSELLVNSATAGNQEAPQVAALTNGGFVVAWQDASQGAGGGATGDTSSRAVRAQAFTADGSRIGGELLVNSATVGDQSSPSIIGLPDDRFVVTWYDTSRGVAGAGGDSSESAIKAQIFDLMEQVETGAPVVTTSAGATTYVEGTDGIAQVAIDPALGLVDPDNSNPGAIVSARIQIATNYRTGEDLLSLSGALGSATFDASTGTLTITANGQQLTTEQWREMIGNVRYSNTSDAPSTAIRTISILVSDGTNWSAEATKNITIIPTNDAPTVDLDAGNPGRDSVVGHIEDGDPTFLFRGPGLSDPDSTAFFPGAVLRIAPYSNVTSGDALEIATGGVIPLSISGNVISFNGVAIGTVAGQGSTELIVTFNAAADLLAVQTVAFWTTFSSSNPNPQDPGPTFSVTFSDGSGGTSVAAFAIVNVFPTPDPTVLDLNGNVPGIEGQVTYDHSNGAIRIAPEALVIDPDTSNFSGLWLMVSIAGATTGDNLLFNAGGAIGLDGNNVTYQGAVIGQFDRASATAANFLLTAANVPTDAVQAIIRAIGFVNDSSSPREDLRFVDLRLVPAGGGGGSAGTVTISSQTSNVAPNAVADMASVASNATTTIAVLSNDTDPDGGMKQVASVAGTAAAVGIPIVLPSGARVTLNADGSLTYDPHGSVGVGSNDYFSYALNGGSSAIVTVSITASSANGVLLGSPAADFFSGTANAESFNLSQGGTDHVIAGGGNDGIYFGAAFGTNDLVDGGAGIDTLALQGNYASLLLTGVSNVDVLLAASGSDTRFGDTANNRYDYSIASVDGNVGAGGTLTVIGSELLAGEDLVFNGAAESDGRFRIFAGRGNDMLTGGSGGDGFFFGADGNLTGADRVNGGAGTDSIALRGNYVGATAVLFQDSSFANFEVLTLLSGHTNEYGGIINANGFDYDVTLANGTLAAGHRLDVIAGNLRANESARVDARAELDGSVRIISGAGDDILFGSAGADFISAGLGADALDGSGSSDLYAYRLWTESTASSRDTITFGSGDRIDLSLIDAASATPANEAFSFIGSAAFSSVAGQLRVVQSGAQWIVEGDVDGNGVADLVIAVTAAAPLGVGDFIL